MPRLRPASWSSSRVSGPSVGSRIGAPATGAVYAGGSGSRQNLADECLGLFEQPVEVALAEEALGVELVDVLGAGRAGGEPAVVVDDLEPADRRRRCPAPWSGLR